MLVHMLMGAAIFASSMCLYHLRTARGVDAQWKVYVDLESRCWAQVMCLWGLFLTGLALLMRCWS